MDKSRLRNAFGGFTDYLMAHGADPYLTALANLSQEIAQSIQSHPTARPYQVPMVTDPNNYIYGPNGVDPKLWWAPLFQQYQADLLPLGRYPEVRSNYRPGTIVGPF